ncbi:hypothetical protein MRB53_042382 [Persea americana]|nr:hypothetical protein MRB53_042382 [Persea americana]
MTDIIYKSVYSNVPVLEIVIRSIPVMRRRKDDWMNATQILKVAGFDKPQRTRILEREVQKGEHEKVQGGYGKYQGTWIPFERGVELATQYEVADIMAPILNYRAGSATPPPALSIRRAASRTVKPAVPRVPRKPKGTPRKVRAPIQRVVPPTRILSSEISDASVEDYKSGRSASPNRTDGSSGSETEDNGQAIFSDQTFSFALASAMGLLDVVAYLKRAGADIASGNNDAQTPFMRVVAFCNNYDLKTFPEIVQQLKDSAHIADNDGRTVFHHIALSTNQANKSKQAAARVLYRTVDTHP